jgi:topoisomerase IV subunit A
MDTVSTAYRPEIRIVYNKLLKETKNVADTVLNLADLIEIKGMKAQGNQVTKLKVKEIVLTHPIDESPEPWPADEAVSPSFDDVEIDTDENDDNDSNDANPGAIEIDANQINGGISEGTTIEWDLTKKLDDDDQMKLF